MELWWRRHRAHSRGSTPDVSRANTGRTTVAGSGGGGGGGGGHTYARQASLDAQLGSGSACSAAGGSGGSGNSGISRGTAQELSALGRGSLAYPRGSLTGSGSTNRSDVRRRPSCGVGGQVVAPLPLPMHARPNAMQCCNNAMSQCMPNANGGAPTCPQAFVTPTFLDLMIWAVLVGERPLARVLWMKTNEPMRAALVAARLSRRLSEQRQVHSASEAAELLEDSAAYEEW